MSVIIRADGVYTSSINLGAIVEGLFTYNDTIPDRRIFANIANAARVVGDSRFDYVYRRGKPYIPFSLNWRMLPQIQVKGLQVIWNKVEMHHWFTVQPTNLAAALTANLYCLSSGTTVNIQVSTDGINPVAGSGTNWIVVDKWMLFNSGTAIGAKERIVNFTTAGVAVLENPITVAAGDRFWIGWPCRFTGPLAIDQIGNINTHYNVSVDCETVIF